MRYWKVSSDLCFYHQWCLLQDADAETHFMLFPKKTKAKAKTFSIFKKRWKTEHQIWTKRFPPILQSNLDSPARKKTNKYRRRKKTILKKNSPSNLGFTLVSYFFSLRHAKGCSGKCQHDSSKHYLMSKRKHQGKLTKSNTVYNFHAFHSIILQFI